MTKTLAGGLLLALISMNPGPVLAEETLITDKAQLLEELIAIRDTNQDNLGSELVDSPMGKHKVRRSMRIRNSNT